MSDAMRTTLKELASDHIEKQAKLMDYIFPPKPKERKLDNSEILKYLALYGVGGAAIGAGTGAAIGGLKAAPMISGGLMGGAAGTGLGALALSARKNRDIDAAREEAAFADAPNVLSRMGWKSHVGAPILTALGTEAIVNPKWRAAISGAMPGKFKNKHITPEMIELMQKSNPLKSGKLRSVGGAKTKIKQLGNFGRGKLKYKATTDPRKLGSKLSTRGGSLAIGWLASFLINMGVENARANKASALRQ